MVNRDYMRDDYGSGGGFGGGGGMQLAMPRMTPMVKILILANIAFFLAQFISSFSSPGLLTKYLGLNPKDYHLYLLQIFSYQFLHGSPGHIFFNMLALFFFGTQIERRLGSHRFLRLYFLAGVAGGMGYLLYSLFQGSSRPCIGASGAVTGVLLYFCCVQPRATIILLIFPVQAWILGAFWMLQPIYQILVDLRDGPSGNVAHSAHLGGALLGFFFWRYEGLVRGYLDNSDQRKVAKQAQKEAGERALMDQLLEKVNREGLTSLSQKERKFLQVMSQKFKKR